MAGMTKKSKRAARPPFICLTVSSQETSDVRYQGTQPGKYRETEHTLARARQQLPRKEIPENLTQWFETGLRGAVIRDTRRMVGDSSTTANTPFPVLPIIRTVVRTIC